MYRIGYAQAKERISVAQTESYLHAIEIADWLCTRKSPSTTVYVEDRRDPEHHCDCYHRAATGPAR
jgi:hypothetical protein